MSSYRSSAPDDESDDDESGDDGDDGGDEAGGSSPASGRAPARMAAVSGGGTVPATTRSPVATAAWGDAPVSFVSSGAHALAMVPHLRRCDVLAILKARRPGAL